MNDFDRLTSRGQVMRLRQNANTALLRYGIADSRLKLLAHHRQTTFQVSASKDCEKYVLRLHRSGYRRPECVQVELDWLRSLRAQTRLVVPEPVATLSGEDVPRLSSDGLPEDLSCSMTKWVAGRRYFRKNGPGPRVLFEVGRIMATMHNHAERCAAFRRIDCPVRNWEQLFGQRSAASTAAERRMLNSEARRLFLKAERRVKAAMEVLGTGRRTFGIIHGDLIQSNYLIYRSAVHLIDFADIGWGHFLYDIGITLFGLWGLDADNRQRRAFVAGYREIRNLPPAQERLVDVFIAARAVVQARFVMTSQHPADRNYAPRFITHVTEGLRIWLNSGKRLGNIL